LKGIDADGDFVMFEGVYKVFISFASEFVQTVLYNNKDFTQKQSRLVFED